MAQAFGNEIAHRTKNNLAIVAGLLQTQLDHQGLAALDPGLVKDAISRIHTFVVLQEQMYRTHSEEVELVSALRQVAELDLQAMAAGNATVTVEGEAIRYPAGVGTNLCVIANELITNALKHGRARCPNVSRFAVWLEAGALHLTVWNSGSTVAPDFEVANQAKTGLDLVHTVVEDQYRGAFRLTPERGGTKAEIVLEEGRLREE